MEMYVDVSALKEQVQLVSDYSGDDSYLERCLKVAHVTAEKHLQRPLSELVDEETGELDPMVEHGILMFAAHLYQTREQVAYVQPHVIPYTLEYLFQPSKKYT